jgi:predicted MFS family arabinose efflux permease
MPIATYVLGLMIFSMSTSEFTVAGIMPSLSKEFDVSIGAVGYLISAYAAGMIVGGPLLSLGLSKVSRKRSFLLLATIFLAGQSLGALAVNYEIMMIARIITGISATACFGVSLAICFDLVRPESRGRAASIVLGGLMVATAVGLPATMLLDQYLGWRSSFWMVVVLVTISGILGIRFIPDSSHKMSLSLRNELSPLKDPGLWAAYLTSMLIIGATFAAFSYFTPILQGLTGFESAFVPILLGVYGVATVLGNVITGRFADRYMMSTLTVGLVILVVSMTMFALFVHNPFISVVSIIFIGLAGVPMNPAMATRITRVAGTGTLVTTTHGSVISLGIVVGSSVGGIAVDEGLGTSSPLWVGAVLAVLGLISLLPFLLRDNQSAVKETESARNS